MKKNYIFSIALLVSGFCALAQPVLEESDFLPNYTADVYIYRTSANIFEENYGEPLGYSGPFQTWIFSGLPLPDTADGEYAVVPVSSVLNSAFFISANYCVKANYVDIYGNDETVYRMYNISSSGIAFLGEISDFRVVICSGHYTYFPFPYIYGAEFSGTHNCVESVSNEFTTIYDGYGTLITPFGFYEDVIREKTVSENILTYRWLKANPFSVIMELNLLINGDAVIYAYKETTSLNINEVNKGNMISVYPNPSNFVVNLQLSNQSIIDKVLITDLTGKIVLQQNQNADQIDVQGLSGGMYVLQVFSENKEYQTKFIKK